MAEVSGLLSRALRRMETGELEPGVGTAIATLTRALIAVRDTSMLEDRLAVLEERAGVKTDKVWTTDRGPA